MDSRRVMACRHRASRLRWHNRPVTIRQFSADSKLQEEARMKRFHCLFLVFLILAGALPLLAQEQTASLEGVVTDPQGGAVPGATVEAVSASGQRFAAQSDATGHYRFPAIPPGTYTVTASLSGMQNASAKNVQVTLGTSKKIDLSMKMAQVTESV